VCFCKIEIGKTLTLSWAVNFVAKVHLCSLSFRSDAHLAGPAKPNSLSPLSYHYDAGPRLSVVPSTFSLSFPVMTPRVGQGRPRARWRPPIVTVGGGGVASTPPPQNRMLATPVPPNPSSHTSINPFRLAASPLGDFPKSTSTCVQ
jgi:hypothetical protein